MNQEKDALRESIDAELAASEAEGGEIPYEEVFRRLQKKIDGKLAAAKARGGETPHKVFMAELKGRYGG